MLIRNCELEPGGERVDVVLREGRVAHVGASADRTMRRAGRAARRSEIDAAGGALLPGLNDHHLHLLALVAAQDSLRCGPPEVSSREALRDALRRAGSSAEVGDWIRGIGYHESVAGPLRRRDLDAWLPDQPVRLQHRSGALWMLNSRALAEIETHGPVDDAEIEGSGGRCERDEAGAPTGRFFRADAWLRGRLEAASRSANALELQSGLAATAKRLACLGVTGLCDATPGNGPAELALFAQAQQRGALPQRLMLMGSDALGAPMLGDEKRTRLHTGARKWILDEAALPELDAFIAALRKTHEQGRCAAVHCVTRTDLAFALAAFREAGTLPGDRVEHAAIADEAALAALAELKVQVITQPNFLWERGDRYALEVEAQEQPWLYRCAGFDRAGVPLGAGTDAPFGEPDPWAAMRAAVERRSRGGHPYSAHERVAPERALALFTSRLRRPGGPARRVARGEPADLVLLDRPWNEARTRLLAEDVRATCCGGRWFSSTEEFEEG